MKAIILAGGSGTRLYPVTQLINKNFLSIYNKPMIYYPLSLAILIGIRDICFIINPQDEDVFKKLFSYLKKIGINVSYVIQVKPNGLAEGLILAEDFIKDSPVLYLLGDNILFGHGLTDYLKEAKKEIEEKGGAYVFGYYLNDPERFGIVEFDKAGRVLSIEEKPKAPKSNYAIIGVYFFDSKAVEFAKKLILLIEGNLK